jgi:hypothetical protein
VALAYGTPPLNSKQLARRTAHALIVAGAVPRMASVVGQNLTEHEGGTDVEKANAEIEILNESAAFVEAADRSDELQRTHHRARHESPAGSKNGLIRPRESDVGTDHLSRLVDHVQVAAAKRCLRVTLQCTHLDIELVGQPSIVIVKECDVAAKRR